MYVHGNFLICNLQGLGGNGNDINFCISRQTRAQLSLNQNASKQLFHVSLKRLASLIIKVSTAHNNFICVYKLVTDCNWLSYFSNETKCLIVKESSVCIYNCVK